MFVPAFFRNDFFNRIKKVVSGDKIPELCAREVFAVLAVHTEICPALIIKSQQIHYILDIDLNKTGLVLLSCYYKIRCGSSQTELLRRAVDRYRTDISFVHGVMGKKSMTASACVGGILRVDDIVGIYKREAVEGQQGLQASYRSAELFVRSDWVIIDEVNSFFHIVCDNRT